MPPRAKGGEAGAEAGARLSSGIRQQLQIFNPGPNPPSRRLRESPTSCWARTKSFVHLPKSLIYLCWLSLSLSAAGFSRKKHFPCEQAETELKIRSPHTPCGARRTWQERDYVYKEVHAGPTVDEQPFWEILPVLLHVHKGYQFGSLKTCWRES